jgi:hypothetical protein
MPVTRSLKSPDVDSSSVFEEIPPSSAANLTMRRANPKMTESSKRVNVASPKRQPKFIKTDDLFGAKKMLKNEQQALNRVLHVEKKNVVAFHPSPTHSRHSQSSDYLMKRPLTQNMYHVPTVQGTLRGFPTR